MLWIDSFPVQTDPSDFLVVVAKAHHPIQVSMERVQLMQRITAQAKEPKRDHRHPRRLYQECASFPACIDPSARDKCSHAHADAKRHGCYHPARALVGAGELQEQASTDGHTHGGDTVERLHGDGIEHTIHFCMPFPLPRSMALFPAPSGIGEGPTDRQDGMDAHPKLLVLTHVFAMDLDPSFLFLFVQALFVLLVTFFFVDLHGCFRFGASTSSFHVSWVGWQCT